MLGRSSKEDKVEIPMATRKKGKSGSKELDQAAGGGTAFL